MSKNRTGYKMQKKILLGFLLLLLTSICYAGKISAPPPLPTTDKNLQFYLKEIESNFHVLSVVTSDPDGSRNGKAGEMIIYNNSGTYYLAVNIDSAQVWSGIQLSPLP